MRYSTIAPDSLNWISNIGGGVILLYAPKDEVIVVRVDDRWHSAIWVDLQKLGLLEVGERDGLDFVR